MLWDALEMARAYERLNDPEYSGKLNAAQYLEACRAAGYSEKASQKAATARANARLDANLPP